MQSSVCTSKLSKWWQRKAPKLLAASWGLGILAGFCVATSAGENLADLVVFCIPQPMSLIGCLSVSVLPFLLAAFAVSFSEPWLLLFISAFKAFSFSFCARGICLAFGQSSWLVLFLFLFSDFLLIPVQYFYWLRHIKGDRSSGLWELPAFLSIGVLVGCFDFFFVAPFLVSLMIK